MSDPLRYHGGNLAAARDRYGAGDWLDLSTGIAPIAWPVPPDLPVDLRSLPDPAALGALEAAAAARFGLPAEHVCAVPGSETGLRLLGTLLDGPACHLTAAYRTHGAIFANGTPLASGETTPSDVTLVLANPNNPCGTLLSPAELAALLAARGAGWLVVDEAFVDPHPEASIASWISDDRRLIVFRSFGKFFGLAGVRLGFVLAPRALIARYRALLGDWPIDATALAIGTRAYHDDTWIDAARADLPQRAAALDAVLRRHGLAPTGASPLFRLVAHPEAAAVFDRLARAHILVRPFDYNPHWLRFGLHPDAAALVRLDRALGHG